MTDKPKLNPFLTLALDIGPLLLFFAGNSRHAGEQPGQQRAVGR